MVEKHLNLLYMFNYWNENGLPVSNIITDTETVTCVGNTHFLPCE